MHSLTPFLALVASGACADIKIVWHHAKASSQTSLSVLNGSTLVAQTCSSIIAGTPHSLDFSDLDDNGLGNFSVGDTTYLAHSDPAYSGGPICTKKYNADVAVVSCSGVNWTPLADAAIEDNRHKDEAVRATIQFFTSSHREMATVSTTTSTVAALVKRNESSHQCDIITSTGMVGDGNPHQNFYNMQLSENIYCGAAPECEVDHTDETSYTVGWSASASAAGWISGGFSVERTWSTGNGYHCKGHQGDTVCVWYNTAHTAFPQTRARNNEITNKLDTVQNGELNTCENEHRWSPDGDPFVMFSPNTDNRNGGYYCVIGTCRAKGDAYWDKSGRAGGP